MNPWGLASVASLAATGGLAAWISLRVPRTVTRLPFVLLMFSFALWDLGEAIVRLAPAGALGPTEAWVRVEWIGITLISGTYLHFVLNFATGRPLGRLPWKVPVVYALPVCVAALVLATDLVVAGVADSPLGPAARLGPGYLPAAIAYEAWLVVALAALVRAYVRSPSAEFRRRGREMIVVLGIATVMGSLTETWWSLFTPYPSNLGLGSVYTLGIAVVGALSELRHRFLEIEAVTEATPARSRWSLRPGAAYLFLSPARDAAFQAFREMVATTPGLCITGAHPRKLQARFGLARTPIVWVTGTTSSERSVRPQALEFELFQTVARFVKSNPSTVVLVDDVDLLAHTNGFDGLSRFLHRTNNLATSRGSTTIAAADPSAFPPARLALLRGMFDEVREARAAVSFLEAVDVQTPGAYLIEGDLDAALTAFRALAPGDRGVVVTTKSPARIRRRVGDGPRVVWIAAPGEAGEGDGERSVDLEAGKLAVDLLGDRVNPVVLLPEVEQIRMHAPFPRVLELVKSLADQVAVRDGILLASAAPDAMGREEAASLRQRFDAVLRA